MADSLREQILIHFCRQRQTLRIIVGLLAAFLLFSIVNLWFLPRDSGAYVINALNVVGLSVFLLAFGALTAYCHKNEDMRYR